VERSKGLPRIPVIGTIVAKNYLAQARCLTESFLAHHPDGRVFVLLVDRPDGYFDPAQEAFTTVLAEEIGIPQFTAMTFRYTLLELSTAVKPFFLQYLFATYDYDALCYVDPDIYFYRRADDVIWDVLREHSILLTPHLTGPLDDVYLPNEVEILRSGAYNLGFIGLARSPQTVELLDWWAGKLTRYCIINHDRGFFVDQRWIDLVPGRFPGVTIQQDPGCNVAYWNLPHRHVARADEAVLVNGRPLTFFHFSGYSPDRPAILSKFQTRYSFDDLPDVHVLFEGYRARLLANGYDAVKPWPNVYSQLSADGVRIPDAARWLWRDSELGDPSWSPLGETPDAAFLSALREWLNEPVDAGQPLVTRLALAVHQQQAFLQQQFPDALGRDRVEYAQWYVTSIGETFQFDPYFVRAMAESLERCVSAKTHYYQRFTRWLFAVGLGQRIEALVGQRITGRIRDMFVPRGFNTASTTEPALHTASHLLPPAASRPIPASPGVNVIGYLKDETGVGESARATLRALDSVDYPVAWTLARSEQARQNDTSVLHLPEGHPYAVNLFYVNADQMPTVYHDLGADFFAGKYNIATWFWELEHFPEAWRDRLQYLDELWVGSHFVQRTLAPLAPFPVVVMGVPITPRPPSRVTRAELGLPEDRFLFLFTFDMLSFIERKNPYAVIDAYRRAFGPDFAGVQLVIKVTKLEQYPEHAARLRAEMASVGGILLDRYLDRPELDGLFEACDAYVSLHRSEGFGMTLAEAMILGKPVIATDYGGNTDFTTAANSYPVAYRLVELAQDCGPYPRGAVWADADVDHAAELMRHVTTHPEEARAKGERAAADIRAWYGPEVMARKIIQRLTLLRPRQADQTAETARLQALVDGYERGRFIRLMKWLRRRA